MNPLQPVSLSAGGTHCGTGIESFFDVFTEVSWMGPQLPDPSAPVMTISMEILPEPGTMALLGMGLLGLLARRRRG